MASPTFGNPVVKARDSGKALKLPGKIEQDPEKGEIVPRSDSPVQIAQPPARYDQLANALHPEAFRYGLITRKAGRKQRKHKKRGVKKTQKRRARK